MAHSVQYTLNNRAFFMQAWLSDNEFTTDNNLAYVKPAVTRDKQHYVYSENPLQGGPKMGHSAFSLISRNLSKTITLFYTQHPNMTIMSEFAHFIT